LEEQLDAYDSRIAELTKELDIEHQKLVAALEQVSELIELVRAFRYALGPDACGDDADDALRRAAAFLKGDK
jgi:hypothetical protein